MLEKTNIQNAKYISLINAFEQFGYKSSNKIGQKEFRFFLNKKSSSGYFDSILCDKLFQVLNIDERSTVPVNKFVEDFIIFEGEILRNADSFRKQFAKEQEIYNKILKQCDLYKSEKLNAEGFCKNAKIYGKITDINIQKKLEGIKEIIILVIFNNKKEELHFKIGDDANNIKKSFEFKPSSRKDHFEFVMKGVNDKGKEFDIGSKIFPLTDIASQEEYLVQIIVPEIGNPNKVAAYINATIVLYMSDYKYYENLRKKQEKRLKKFKKAAEKSAEYLKYIREIYGDIKLMKQDITVNFNNEKLMQRRGAKLNVNIDNEVEEEMPRGNYYVEFHNERKVLRKGSPLKVEFNNLKPNSNNVIETKKVFEYNYQSNYNNLIEQNITKKADQLLQKIEKENININNIQHNSQQIPPKKEIQIEQGMNHVRLFSDFDTKEEMGIPKDLNTLNINQGNQQIYSNEQILTEQNKSSRQLDSQSDLEKIMISQNSEKNPFKNIQQTNTEIIQNISPSSQYIQNIQQNQNKFNIDDYIKQKYNVNGSQKFIQHQQQLSQNITNNLGSNTQQKTNQINQNKIQGNNVANSTNNITTTKNITKTVIQKTLNQPQVQISNNSNLNMKKIDQNNQYNNKGNIVTELDRASIYQIVNDISKKDTVTSQPQNLTPIINKTDYNISVNKAITHETTNKEIVSENILPVSYLPEKVHKLIVSDQVTYLPLATTQKKVTYNNPNPIINESEAYFQNRGENNLTNINNINLSQNITRNNIINNSDLINNNYNYPNNIPINQVNNKSYLGQNYNHNINSGNFLNNYNLNSNNIIGNNNWATTNKTTKVTTKRLISQSNPGNNFQIQNQGRPIFQTSQVYYGNLK